MLYPHLILVLSRVSSRCKVLKPQMNGINGPYCKEHKSKVDMFLTKKTRNVFRLKLVPFRNISTFDSCFYKHPADSQMNSHRGLRVRMDTVEQFLSSASKIFHERYQHV